MYLGFSAKSVVLLFELKTAMPAADTAIQKKNGSVTTELIISNEEMENVMKTVKSLEESRLLIKGIRETIKNDAKKQQGGFLRMLWRILAARILGNALTGKGVIRAGERVKRAG